MVAWLRRMRGRGGGERLCLFCSALLCSVLFYSALRFAPLQCSFLPCSVSSALQRSTNTRRGDAESGHGVDVVISLHHAAQLTSSLALLTYVIQFESGLREPSNFDSPEAVREYFSALKGELSRKILEAYDRDSATLENGGLGSDGEGDGEGGYSLNVRGKERGDGHACAPSADPSFPCFALLCSALLCFALLCSALLKGTRGKTCAVPRSPLTHL